MNKIRQVLKYMEFRLMKYLWKIRYIFPNCERRLNLYRYNLINCETKGNFKDLYLY